MPATEDQSSAKPEETKPVEAISATEAPATAATAATEPAAADAEKAILTKDPAVVASALEKAEPVSTEVSTSAASAPAETTAAADDAPAPATPEKHKEGSSIIGFLKKHVPNPKTIDKKSATKSTTEGKKPATDATTKSETEPTAAATSVTAEEDKPFESDIVDFKTHGGFFGGGWKSRVLMFGKEDGYGQSALAPYVAAHKLAALMSSPEKTNAAYDNAAHATSTGVGLLFIVKSKAVDVPLNIINLADVTGVTVGGTHFTVKTELGEYEFIASSLDKAKKWKQEIEARVEQSKLTRSGVQENNKYKEAFSYFKDMHSKAGHKSEAVTSDEEGAVSGEEGKRSGKWTRRISGSFQKFTGSSKDTTAPKEQTSETPKEASSAPEAAATESAAAPESAPATAEATAATESAVVDTSADTSAEQSKKDKRKSLGGFAGLWKGKGVAKEASPEPTASKEVTDDTPATAETPAAAPEESSAGAEETSAPTEPKATKRHSIFSGLLPKTKDKSTSTAVNGDTPIAETSEPAPTTTETSAPAQTSTDDAEFKPIPAKKDSLSRRLTSQIKSFGRSKSPEKNKASKVSDEAPKIETAIGTTPEATTTTPAAAATASTAEEKKVDTIEPLATTEAPHTSTEAAPSTEHTSVPEVSTKA